MIAPSWMLVLVGILAADLTPAELVGRLGSPDRVVREEAARTLEEQGLDAIPALDAARAAAREPLDRDRFATLIERVQARMLNRPTLVAVDFADVPLGEAIAALAQRSGFAVALDDPALAGRRVTVQTNEPVPFWDALDRVSQAGHIRHDPGRRSENEADEGKRLNLPAATIRLVDGDPPDPTTSAGPLRIHVFATHQHRDRSFKIEGNPRLTPRSPTTTIEVQAFAEPGREIHPNGLPRLEAIDEQGHALTPQPPSGSNPSSPEERSWLEPGRLSLLHWHIPLGLPVVAVGTLMHLRGVLPVVVTKRSPDPTEIVLKDALGKTLPWGQGKIRITKVANANGSTSVEFVLIEAESPGESNRVATRAEPEEVDAYLRSRIEFQDDAGQPLGWNMLGISPRTRFRGETQVQTYVAGKTPPARLRIYRLNRLATELPFEFPAIPSP